MLLCFHVTVRPPQKENKATLCGLVNVPNHTLTNAWWKITILVGDPQAANMTYLSELKIYQPDFNHWSANILWNYTQWTVPNISNARHSATSIGTLDGWNASTFGKIHPNSTNTSVRIDDIFIGPYARETWYLDLNDTKFTWRTTREYLVDLSYQCTRFPTLVLNTQYQAGSNFVFNQSQIPSTLDSSFQWNSSGFAFPCRMGEIIPTGDPGMWSFTHTVNSNATLLLSPADLTVQSTSLVMNSSGGASPTAHFSLAWPDYPGTGGGDTCMSMGITSGVGFSNTTVRAGQQQDVAWSLDAQPSVTTEASRLSVRTKNATFDFWLKKMTRVFNMWAGNMFGNSPASISCLHEMSFYSQIASVFDPVGGLDSEYHRALRQMLTLFATHAVTDNGWVYPRWQQYQYVQMAIHDQIPHFLMAYYHYAVTTGDKDFIRGIWPQLMKVFHYIMNDMTMARDGLATTPRAPGLPWAQIADNWFDIINFGGKDAIINAYIVTALNSYAEMAIWIGENSTAEVLLAQYKRSVQAFNTNFWNDTTGMYSDWIDTANQKRNYFYGWQQALAVDPASGIASQQQKERIIQAMNNFYADIHQTYDKFKTLWCSPTNFIGVAKYDSWFNGTWQDEAEYGHYENGACFVALMGLEIALRGYAGDGSAAFDMFTRVIDQFATTRMWGQHYDWIGEPAGWLGWNGPDVLTDSLMAVWGLLRGVLQIQPTLLRGVVVHGSAPPELEGLEHTFLHLGKPVTIKVENGDIKFF